MKHLKRPILALACAALLLPLPALAREKGFDGGPADPRSFQPDNPRPRADQRPPRPMMIPHEARGMQRRQGAKCMNAYPDDHGSFTDCMKSGGYSRPQLMPMPTRDNRY
jgi:hypothetical protein